MFLPGKKWLAVSLALGTMALAPLAALADGGTAAPAIMGVRVEFIFFALTLLCVALFHHKTMQVALTGLAIITAYKLIFTGFHAGPGFAGLAGHLFHEWVTLTNLLGLLLGFEILAHHFSASKIPAWLPRILPAGAPGAFSLLVMVFILSGFLDNIAAAMIGGTIAVSVFKGRIHIGYLAAIVAASNAGGAGSVLGDTTTTMMWIDGVNPLDVLHAYLPAAVALLFFGVIASWQQHKHHPIAHDERVEVTIDHGRVGIVVTILVVAMGTNIVINSRFNQMAESFPWLGAAVWAGILITAPIRRPHWGGIKHAFRGSVFLLALVTCASMMPVETLPKASWLTTLGLGAVSSVFDNIPLTKLALQQGGYDWGVLAYAVGFGGSMLWFGSSAGVAISNIFNDAKDTVAWVRGGWHVVVAYFVAFFVLIYALGWHPHEPHKAEHAAPPATETHP